VPTLVHSLGSCRSTIELHPRYGADSSGFRPDSSRTNFQSWARSWGRSYRKNALLIRKTGSPPPLFEHQLQSGLLTGKKLACSL